MKLTPLTEKDIRVGTLFSYINPGSELGRRIYGIFISEVDGHIMSAEWCTEYKDYIDIGYDFPTYWTHEEKRARVLKRHKKIDGQSIWKHLSAKRRSIAHNPATLIHDLLVLEAYAKFNLISDSEKMASALETL